jgi:hypothetical protein
MLEKYQDIVGRVGDWYILEYGTNIRVYNTTIYPHLLPKFILVRLALPEIAYQTLVDGVGANLKGENKMIWPPLTL